MNNNDNDKQLFSMYVINVYVIIESNQYILLKMTFSAEVSLYVAYDSSFVEKNDARVGNERCVTYL